MGRQSVRAALVDWFSPPGVAQLTKVFAGMPVWASGDTWEFDVSGTWAAIAYVHLAEDSEQRIGLGGPQSGEKMITYRVGIVLLGKYLVPNPVPLDADSSEWVTYADGLVDAVKARIRADRTLGTNGQVIWQAGEGEGVNTPDIVVQSDIPTLDPDGGVLHIWQAMTFTLYEVITA